MRSGAVRNSQRILAAAREVVAERGARVPMEVIAQRAGVAVGTLYRHHATKTELLAAAVRDTMASVADATEEAQSRIASGADARRYLDLVLPALRHAPV